MSWSDTHRRYDTLRAIEAELDRRRDGLIEWQPEYAALFGDPAQLALVLHTRWDTMVDAQVERYYADDGTPSDELRTLAAAHPGLVRAIARTDRSGWYAELLASVDLTPAA